MNITFVDVGFGIFLCLTFLMAFKPFERSGTIFGPSFMAKLWVIYTAAFLYAIFVAMYIQGRLLLEISIYSFFTFCFPLYIVYAVLMFKYEFNGRSIIWFNGLFQRRIDVHDLRRVTLIKEQNKIVKIGLTTEFQSYRIRNDLDVAGIFITMARKTKIPLF